jgi:hypothetical protein
MRIRILGIDYNLTFTDIKGCNDVGVVNVFKTEITISNVTNSPEHAKSVLLHEIIEAINHRLGLELKHSQITALESGLFQVLKDNPDLFKKILDNNEELKT